MWNLGSQQYTAVDVSHKANGYQVVGMGGEVGTFHDFPVTHVTVSDDGTVKVEAAVIPGHRSLVEIPYAQRAEGLVILRVRPLHTQLQRVRPRVVLVEQGLTDGRYPLMGIGI